MEHPRFKGVPAIRDLYYQADNNHRINDPKMGTDEIKCQAALCNSNLVRMLFLTAKSAKVYAKFAKKFVQSILHTQSSDPALNFITFAAQFNRSPSLFFKERGSGGEFF